MEVYLQRKFYEHVSIFATVNLSGLYRIFAFEGSLKNIAIKYCTWCLGENKRSGNLI